MGIETYSMDEILGVMQDGARQLLADRVEERGVQGIPWLMLVLGYSSDNAVKYLLDGLRWRKGKDGTGEKVPVPVTLEHLAAVAKAEEKRASQILNELVIRVKALEGERRALARGVTPSAGLPHPVEDQNGED